MSQFPDADEPLDDFISSLAQSAGIEGWTLVRFQTSHTDRSYELRGDHRVAPFTAKVSLTEKPFWGLTESKAQHIAQSKREHLLLLVDGGKGFFISTVAFQRLLPKFSRTREGAVRIKPNTIKAEARFVDASDAFEQLKARSYAPEV
jgi:hypothetical protein